MLKIALVVSMFFQLGAAVFAISLIRRTRFNISWILISSGLVLMAIRRLFDFSTFFWESKLFQKDEINGWIGVFISVFMFVGVIFIRKIFNLQDRIEQLRQENEQNVLSAVIQTEDKARQNFARELHDGLGPVLSSIKMTLSAVNSETLSPVNKKIIESACYASDNSIVALKEIANNLSPHLLKNYGLKKALETSAHQLFSPMNILVDLMLSFDENHLSEEMKITCYRIVNELMNNSLKHANPTVVYIEIMEDANILEIHYRDNGVGFENSPARKKVKAKGMGFSNMFSRTKSLRGSYFIQTAPGKGFSIDFQFPLS